jgi:Mn2+/Fe2+ NRAMP family transporter
MSFVSNNREVMGERAIGRRLNVLGWGTTAVMAIAAIALVVITIVG